VNEKELRGFREGNSYFGGCNSLEFSHPPIWGSSTSAGNGSCVLRPAKVSELSRSRAIFSAMRVRDCSRRIASRPSYVKRHRAGLPLLARMQRVEIGNASEPEDHRLATDDELLPAVLQGSPDDPRKSFGPVVSATGDQPHGFSVAIDAHVVAVTLYLVEPVGAGQGDLAGRRQAELEFWYAVKIGMRGRIAN
jgi:hypothetical protein